MSMSIRVLNRLLDGGLVSVRSLHLCPSLTLCRLSSAAASAFTVQLHQLPHCNTEKVNIKQDTSRQISEDLSYIACELGIRYQFKL